MSTNVESLHKNVDRIGKYLFALRRGDDADGTARWMVMSHRGAILGEIGWYAQWREYTFSPETFSAYSHDCLSDIARFLVRCSAEHAKKESA